MLAFPYLPEMHEMALKLFSATKTEGVTIPSDPEGKTVAMIEAIGPTISEVYDLSFE